MINSILHALGTFCNWLLDLILSAFRSIWDFITNPIKNIISENLDPILEKFPDLQSNLESVTLYMSWANEWINIDLALILFSIWCVTVVSVTLLNWILGLIPTVN